MGLETGFAYFILFLEIKPLFYFSSGESLIHFENLKALFHWKKMIMISVTVITIYTIMNCLRKRIASAGRLPEFPKE